MGLDTHDLRAFCRVIDLGSVTAAARSLDETKGAVSRRLTRLERALGARLLQRAGRTLVATEEGLAWRDRAAAALGILDDAAAALRARESVPSGHLKITAPTDLGTMMVAPLVAGFVDRYPAVTVEVLLTDERLALVEHGIDVALRVMPHAPTDTSLIGHKLVDLDGDLFASPAYVAEHGMPEHPSELDRHRMVIFPQRGGLMSGTLVNDDGERIPVRLQGTVLSRDLLFLRQVALAGGGIAPIVRRLAEQDVRDGRLVRVLPGWQMDFKPQLWLLYPGGTLLPPKVRAFRDFVREEITAGKCERAMPATATRP